MGQRAHRTGPEHRQRMRLLASYSENPGNPTEEERGTYCPHGAKIMEHVFSTGDEEVYQVIEPWQCDRPRCTEEEFVRTLAEAVRDGADDGPTEAQWQAWGVTLP